MELLALAWLTFAILLAPFAYADVTAPWPSSLEFLATGSDAEFSGFVTPLAEMTKLTYTATWGSYFNPHAENESVAGWQRGLEHNPLVGMRALTFIQSNSTRGVLAFRGTDLITSQSSGQADTCADAFLQLDLKHSLPPWCNQFTLHQLDYLSRALEFAERIVGAYPSIHWLYTGHSLGAALAQLVAAQRGASAATFSAPALKPLLPRLQNPTLRTWGAVTFYDQYDPLRFTALNELWNANCTWHRSSAPTGCHECEERIIDMHSDVCEECFMKAHIFKHYLELVLSGKRPDCHQRHVHDPFLV